MTSGIYTLANDNVYDQLIALLNSIEANAGTDVPVCILPYDDRLERVRDAIQTRPHVTLLDDPAILSRWEAFAQQVWQVHPHALQTWKNRGETGIHRMGTFYRYCAFDADSPFDRFIYMDADTLLLSPLEPLLRYLDDYEYLSYDFQYKDLSHVFDLDAHNLTAVFPQERLDREIFCSGFYISRRNLFSPEQLNQLIADLAGGDADILYLNAPDQTVLNYMILKLGISACNLALHLPVEQRTGNSVTSPHFEQRGGHLFDQGKPLTYLHYIGLSSRLFRQVCAGENIDFPYRDIFLHYRYLHDPSQRPQYIDSARSYDATPSLMQRALKKLGVTL